MTERDKKQPTSRSLGAKPQPPTDGSDAGCDGNRAPTETMNLNDTVWVRLTDAGRDAARKDWESIGILRPYEPRPEVDGWSAWQLWDLANVLGPFMGCGFSVPCETEIRLQPPRTNASQPEGQTPHATAPGPARGPGKSEEDRPVTPQERETP